MNAPVLIVGNEAAREGTVVINGVATKANITGLFDRESDGGLDGAVLTTGVRGKGVATVSNGASVLIDSLGPPDPGARPGGIFVGSQSTGDGTLNIESGAKISAKTGNTVIGGAGAGALNISGGGVLDGTSQSNSIVGRFGTSTGTVNVDGAGSQWLARQKLFIGAEVDFATGLPVGPGGTAKVFVTNDGFVKATDIYVGSTGQLGGNGSIEGNLIVDGGMITPGTSAGRLSLTGNYTHMAASTLEIEIESLTVHDILDVMGGGGYSGRHPQGGAAGRVYARAWR